MNNIYTNLIDSITSDKVDSELYEVIMAEKLIVILFFTNEANFFVKVN